MGEKTLIVGAGPGGSVAAYLLCRAGMDVELVDRSKFPRDKACGDALTTAALSILESIGLDRIEAQTHRLDGLRHLGRLDRPVSALDAEVVEGYTVSELPRFSLDAMLLESAVSAGARFTQADLIDVETTDDSPHVTLRLPDGTVTQRRPDWLIGADGSLSRVAQLVGLYPGRTEDTAFSIRQYLRTETQWDRFLELWELPEPNVGYGWLLPVDEKRANAGVYVCGRNATKGIATLLDQMRAAVAVSLTGAGRVVEDSKPMAGLIRYDFSRERVAHNRTLLLGDAAGLALPVTGDGISSAILSSTILTATLLDTRHRHWVAAEYADRLDGEFSEGIQQGRAMIAAGHTVGSPLIRGWPGATDPGKAQKLPDVAIGSELAPWSIIDDDFRNLRGEDFRGRWLLLVNLVGNDTTVRAMLGDLEAQSEVFRQLQVDVVLGIAADYEKRRRWHREAGGSMTWVGVSPGGPSNALVVDPGGVVREVIGASDPHLAGSLLDMLEASTPVGRMSSDLDWDTPEGAKTKAPGHVDTSRVSPPEMSSGGASETLPVEDLYDDTTRVARCPGTAATRLDSELILANERSDSTVTLDPVESVVWEFLDGEVSLGELVDDLGEVLALDEPTVRTRLDEMLRRLADGGCLLGGQSPATTPRADRHRSLPGTVGDAVLGLADTHRMTVYGPAGPVVEIAATESGVIDALLTNLPEDHNAEPSSSGSSAPIYVLRTTSGRVPRNQYLFNGAGERLAVSTDTAEAESALDRTLSAQITLQRGDGVWLDGPVLQTDRGAILFPPDLRPMITERLRAQLSTRRIGLVPSGLVRLEISSENGRTAVSVGVPAGLLEKTSGHSWPLIGLLVRSSADSVNLISELAHLMARWDDPHLATAKHLAEAVPVHQLQTRSSRPDQILRMILEVAAPGDPTGADLPAILEVAASGDPVDPG